MLTSECNGWLLSVFYLSRSDHSKRQHKWKKIIVITRVISTGYFWQFFFSFVVVCLLQVTMNTIVPKRKINQMGFQKLPSLTMGQLCKGAAAHCMLMRSKEVSALWEYSTEKTSHLKGLLYVCMCINHVTTNTEQNTYHNYTKILCPCCFGNRQPREKVDGLFQRGRVVQETSQNKAL